MDQAGVLISAIFSCATCELMDAQACRLYQKKKNAENEVEAFLTKHCPCYNMILSINSL